MWKKKQVAKGEPSTSFMDMEGQTMDIKSIMKDIEFLGSSHMTWKERKELENRKVVALGGKHPKKHRVPLSVALVQMKKQKEREERMQQESLILSRFRVKLGGGAKRVAEKRKPEESVLKSVGGHFRKGVLDIKHLIPRSTSRDSDDMKQTFNKGYKKKGGGGKKNRGKKGGGKKRH